MPLPHVPTDSNNEKQHRTVLATTVNELVKVHPPHDRTEEERAAGVRPIDPRYAPGDDRRYNTLNDFLKVVALGVEGHIWTDHTIATAHDITGDAAIIVHGSRSITAATTMDYMLRHSGELTIEATGELLLDGDAKVNYACLHSTAKLPKLKNVRLLDANFGWNTGATVSAHDYGVTGNGVLENVIAENCADVGFTARGNATQASQTATLVLKNCETRGTTGSDDYDSSGSGYLAHVAGMYEVRWEGGKFTGDSGALLTNAYNCSHASVDGGLYHDIARGPTMGNSTQNFAIVGTRCRGISGNAINADTTDGSGATTGVGRLSGNVANDCGRAIRTTCSYVDVTDNISYECTGSGTAFVFAGDDAEVWFDGNHDYSSTLSRISFGSVEGCVVKVGKNITNSTARNAYNAGDAGSEFIWEGESGEARTMATSGDVLPTDRVLLVDASAATVDVDLPNSDQIRNTGFQFTLINVDTTNDITITFQGGAANGEVVNGATGFTIPAGTSRQEIVIRCADGSNGVWYASNYFAQGSATFDPASLADGQGTATNVTVAGAALGDFAEASFSNDLQGITVTAWVSSANTVRVRFQNESGGTLDLASGTLRARVRKA